MGAAPRIQRLAIVGVGLIGGSLARALRAAGAVGEIVGYAPSADSRAQALALGVVDSVATSLEAAVAGADMVVVSVPVGAMEGVFAAIAPHLAEDAVVTDAGSTKGSVVAAAQATLGAALPRFVPGHPIAGTERSGVEAAFAELFSQRRVILTPTATTEAAALARVTAMWEQAGARVECMEVGHHDEVLAATSHLPHVLAYALVDTLAQLEEKREVFRYAAGGFTDFTRIASSNPQMWHDICMANRPALKRVLGEFATVLERLATAIEAGDGDTVRGVFERAKAARDRFCPPPD